VHKAIFNLLFYLCFVYIGLTFIFDFKAWLSVFIALLACLVILISQLTTITLSSASKWFMLFNSTDNQSTKYFILSETGLCQFNDRKLLQISDKSHINLWGYWLVFTTSDIAFRQCFIFKDSLSSEDQARLARTIIRIKTSSELNI